VDIALSDGSRFEVRPIRPDDKPRLADGLSRLSPESVRRRFLTPKPRFSSMELRYLTEVDGYNHVALVAAPAEQPDRIAAVARFVRLADDPAVAEFAIVVADSYQGRGLGRELAMRLTERARELGVRRFTATTQADNVAAQKLIEAIAGHLEYVRQGAVTEVVAELAA
jgi:RimJ/RimL family protein N-acetyltransferase